MSGKGETNVTAPLIGYADRVSVRAGEKISFKVSSAGPGPYHAMLVQIVRGDPNPAGTTQKLEDMSELFDGRFASRTQHAWPGSYALRPQGPPAPSWWRRLRSAHRSRE